MKYWRMAFRIGDQGYEMWPDCYDRGIAAIGYYTNDGKPVVKDCSKLTETEYDEIWRKKRPRSIAPRSSLKNVVYRMKKGHTIYVKQGLYIVGKGVITRKYKYDPDILEPKFPTVNHRFLMGFNYKYRRMIMFFLFFCCSILWLFNNCYDQHFSYLIRLI